ncbi:MAG: hypothetical protein PVH61_19610 [Candidatus Aminicenantes bacterium]|jgi:hypothetical protein
MQDERGRIEYALEEGIKIGEEKGIKKGKIETAKELLKLGIEIEIYSYPDVDFSERQILTQQRLSRKSLCQ